MDKVIKVGGYEIYENDILGKGSFSVVYKGKYVGTTNKNIKYGKTVAVKVIKTDKMTPKSIKVIDDEMDIMNMIKEFPHPNIVECYDKSFIKKSNFEFTELNLDAFCYSQTKNTLCPVMIKKLFVEILVSK